MTPRPKRLHWLGYGVPGIPVVRLWQDMDKPSSRCLLTAQIPPDWRWTIGQEMHRLIHARLYGGQR